MVCEMDAASGRRVPQVTAPAGMASAAPPVEHVMSFVSILWARWCRMQDDLPEFDDDAE